MMASPSSESHSKSLQWNDSSQSSQDLTQEEWITKISKRVEDRLLNSQDVFKGQSFSQNPHPNGTKGSFLNYEQLFLDPIKKRRQTIQGI